MLVFKNMIFIVPVLLYSGLVYPLWHHAPYRLEAWSVKLILDGEFDNAWMRPEESFEGKATKRYTPAESLAVVELCAERGWPLCIHAMGGGAIGCVIDAVADAVARGAAFRPAQVSIAHAFLASAEDVHACAQLGRNAFALVGDVTKLEAVPTIIDQAERLAGTISILVNNAGVHLKKPAIETSDAEFAQVLQEKAARPLSDPHRTPPEKNALESQASVFQSNWRFLPEPLYGSGS